MKSACTLYGWYLSYFTGKARSYLRYKQIAFLDQPVNMWRLLVTIKRKTGVVVMPVLHTPQGEWIHDSSIIIDRMEALYPALPVLPATPVQNFLAHVLEAWGDEFWVPIAMHTRWSYAENYALFEADAGAHLLPHFPAFLQRRAVARVARSLRAMLPAVGVRPEQFAMIELWTHHMLDLLDAHFAQQPYLLGGHPTIADFGLAGTMIGHLGRDRWPAREMIAPRPNLRAWIDRMDHPPRSEGEASLLPNDAIAPTLLPVLALIFREFIPMLEQINTQVGALLPTMSAGQRLPRGLGDIAIPMLEQTFRRRALPYTLWMLQRAQDRWRAMSQAEQVQVNDWLRAHGGARLLTIQLPRLRLAGLGVALA